MSYLSDIDLLVVIMLVIAFLLLIAFRSHEIGQRKLIEDYTDMLTAAQYLKEREHDARRKAEYKTKLLSGEIRKLRNQIEILEEQQGDK